MSGAPDGAVTIEALWLRMVDLAEANHDLVVTSQAAPSSESVTRIAAQADNLGTLARKIAGVRWSGSRFFGLDRTR